MIEALVLVLFAARDTDGRGLDCLKVEAVGPGQYLGVHHSLKDGVFELRLVKSTDFRTWKSVVRLDNHAHQGTIRKVGSQWLLAWEKDGPNGNYMHVAAYASLTDLEAARPAFQKDIARTLSPGAEGTPCFERIQFNGDWAKSRIQIRFHYYRNLDVDRQASGELVNFDRWTCAPLPYINGPLESTYRGNIGDRDISDGYELMEAQLRKEDWASWRILGRNAGAAYRPIQIDTPGKSQSFANPNLTYLPFPDGSPGAVLTLFMPSQGNAVDESGTLIIATPASEMKKVLRERRIKLAGPR
jgi:hypothetical protein